MNIITEHFDSNDDTPEIHRQQGDVKEGSRGETEEERSKTVKDRQTERIADKIASDCAVPGRLAEGVVVEDSRLRTVDDHSEKGHLAQYLVDRASRHEIFLASIGKTVERRTD